MACVVAIACQKGGTGKTTTTMTLGAALGAEKGRRVLLVDLDPQSSLSISAQVDVLEVQRSIYEVLQAVLRKPGTLRETLEGAILQTSFKNVDIIPATLELANAELELAGSLEREKILKAILAPLRKTYDFILVDCPPSLGLLTVNALVAADQVLIPVEADYLALRGVQLFMETTLPQQFPPVGFPFGYSALMRGSRETRHRNPGPSSEGLFSGNDSFLWERHAIDIKALFPRLSRR